VPVTRSPRRLSAAAVVIAASLAACGSSGPSESHFERTVNLICLQADESLGVSPTQIKSARSFGEEISRTLPIYARELRQLRAVKPASSNAGNYATMLRLLARENVLLRNARAPLLAGKLGAAKRFTTAVEPVALKAYEVETKMGLQVCAKST
jgi:hypothetical protein